MLYRFLAALIIVFWLTMMALLVRKELGSNDHSLREVPVSHVMKLMFLHEQVSDLQIYNEKLPVGRVRIHPHLRKEDGQRLVEFTGTMQLAIPGLERQRISWTASLELDQALAVERFKATLNLRQSATIDLLLDPIAHRLTYENRSGDRLIRHTEYSLDDQGAFSWLRDQGIDPGLVTSLYDPRSSPVVVRALQSSLAVHDEKIDTFRLSAQQGGQTLIEFHVSQLGQILRARTFLGFSAAPEDLLP